MQWGKATNMGKMGYGYGSEFHLLRYLGYHRHQLNRAVEEQTSGHIIDWLDFAFGRDGEADSEWKGVDFLDSAPDVKSAWLEFWPQMGNVPNWDAVGRLESNSGIAYLLVEAKAHVEELQSSWQGEGREQARWVGQNQGRAKDHHPARTFASIPASCFPCGSEPRFDSSITRTTDPRFRFLMLPE